ncbi:MAG: TIGR01548 family HAD-type hydrolase [Halobacteriaceae archaeon]
MRADAVVLDVDGVLVDVSDSYRRAVVESVEIVHGRTIDAEILQQFKAAGGFNNDWALTDAVALFVLASDRGAIDDVETYIESVESHGGGVEGALAAVDEALSASAASAVREDWDPEHLRAVFQSLYLGEELYAELEGGDPVVHTEGYIHEEPVLVDPATIETLTARFPVGVLTGRPAAEAEIALDRVGLDLPDERVVTMEDWPGEKPDPSALMDLARLMDADATAFAGDTLDDVRTALNAAETDGGRQYHGIGVLTGGQTADSFDGVGAAATVKSVNELPSLLDA